MAERRATREDVMKYIALNLVVDGDDSRGVRDDNNKPLAPDTPRVALEHRAYAADAMSERVYDQEQGNGKINLGSENSTYHQNAHEDDDCN